MRADIQKLLIDCHGGYLKPWPEKEAKYYHLVTANKSHGVVIEALRQHTSVKAHSKPPTPIELKNYIRDIEERNAMALAERRKAEECAGAKEGYARINRAPEIKAMMADYNHPSRVEGRIVLFLMRNPQLQTRFAGVRPHMVGDLLAECGITEIERGFYEKYN